MHGNFAKCVNTANQLYQQDDKQGAADYYRKALELKPRARNVIYNLAVTLRELRDWEASRHQYESLLRLNPASVRALNGLGVVLDKMGSYQQAVDSYRKAIEYRDQFADAHFNLGMLLLRMGRYQEGWAESEWRWKTNQFTPLNCPKPRWDGKRLQGTLLLHTEQGAGDAMQFIRFLPQAAALCDRIMLICTENMVSLFESVPGVDEMRQAGQIPLEDFDAYIPLMSLPYLFDIGLDKVITSNPYLTAPDRDVQLPPPAVDDAQLKIGIIWAGSPTHKNDSQRSCEPSDFLPLLQIPGTAFYSLQVGEKAGQLKQLVDSPREIVDLKDLQTEFGDAAVLINQLDLVISVDTAILHLAGALGRPAWGLLSRHCDWRWMVEREDTPWYPSLRLFRQHQEGDWEELFERVAGALSEQLNNSRNS